MITSWLFVIAPRSHRCELLFTLQLHNHFSIGMGGMNRRLYSDTFEDFHTSPLIINKIEHCIKSDNSRLNTVCYRIIKTLGHSSHPDFGTTRFTIDDFACKLNF